MPRSKKIKIKKPDGRTKEGRAAKAAMKVGPPAVELIKHVAVPLKDAVKRVAKPKSGLGARRVLPAINARITKVQETLIDRAAKVIRAQYGLSKQDWIRELVLKEAERLAPPLLLVGEVIDEEAPAPAEVAPEPVATPPTEVIPQEPQVEITAPEPVVHVHAPVQLGGVLAALACGCRQYATGVMLCPDHMREAQRMASPSFPQLVIPSANGQLVPDQH